MPRYKVFYTIDGDYDPKWQDEHTFDDGTGDGIITVPFGSSVLGDRIPYRIPKDANVTEVWPNGFYLNKTTGTLYKRIPYGNQYQWLRFDREVDSDWTLVFINELEFFKGFDIERLI